MTKLIWMPIPMSPNWSRREVSERLCALRQAGFFQGRRSGFPSWNEAAYLADNPEVAQAVAEGTFASGFDHYLKSGRAEGRLKGLRLRWVEDSYLARPP